MLPLNTLNSMGHMWVGFGVIVFFRRGRPLREARPVPLTYLTVRHITGDAGALKEIKTLAM